ncbi:MAG TPA: histidine--tRNA ligase [bacterium]
MSKTTFQSPKGTKDILPEEQAHWQYVEEVIRHVVRLYGYERLDLPLFEETALFQRGVGEGTDIVEKEMYTFMDKGGTPLTLRPEFTASVIRAYIAHGMENLPKPVKVWSMGPVFRYERPQAGRYRQFHQFNVEAIGEKDPALDFEVMQLAWHLYDRLGFKNLGFQLNSIGCPTCKPAYLERLVEHYRNHINSVCEDCRKRLTKNPLRVLDCKNQSCQPVIESAPPIYDTLCAECAGHFQSLRQYLDDMRKPYTLNHRLVRGLDYYTKTVFEVWAEGIGAQTAVCGGGRYDGLAEILGGAPTPAVGFASGLERIILTLRHQQGSVPPLAKPSVYFAFLGPEAEKKAVVLLNGLREQNIDGIMGFGSKSLKAQLREADKRKATFTVILGDSEMANGQAIVRRMEGGVQETVSWHDLPDALRKAGRF